VFRCVIIPRLQCPAQDGHHFPTPHMKISGRDPTLGALDVLQLHRSIKHTADLDTPDAGGELMRLLNSLRVRPC
jgi:hypothetical protein